jgi:hypothetical protein
MIDRDQLDRLLHDLAHDRAGDEVVPPDDTVLDDLRARGRTRRRRRFRLAIVAVAFVVTGAMAALVRLPGGDRTDRVDVVDEPATTTTTTSSRGPAVGASARSYVGITVLTHENDRRLWTDDGQSLAYLNPSGHVAVDGTSTVVAVADGERTMLWLLDSPSPDHGTILDAVEVPTGAGPAGLGAGCTSPTTEAQVVAAVADSSPTSDALTAVAAWTVHGDAFDPLPAPEVRCTGRASAT